jgi:hypothetical protein
MSVPAKDIMKWLMSVNPNDQIAIPDGWSYLVVVNNQSNCLEIGGLPAKKDKKKK